FLKGDHRGEDALFSSENRQRVLDALESIRPIANAHQCTFAQLIASCSSLVPGITGVLVGARNAAQALENAQALKLQLSAQERDQIMGCLEKSKIRS
ncbi:MAG: aldo/keto reductase, partial [Chlamydiota bacterium]